MSVVYVSGKRLERARAVNVIVCDTLTNVMDLQTIKTPSLVLDAERVRRNAERMSERVRRLGATLRPHVKTHKCVEGARMQTAGGPACITVSTLAEARAFAAHGFTDITYAVPIEPGKFDEAVELSRLCERLNLLTDDASVPQLRDAGIEVPVVSVGSTPTVATVDHLDGVDEARPGNYIFFDAFQATLGSCSFADCALTVLAAVVHRDRARRKVVLDAGAVALSKDRGPVELDPTCGFGRVLDLEGGETGLRVESVSQEHGAVGVEDERLFDALRVGARVRVLANHSCLA